MTQSAAKGRSLVSLFTGSRKKSSRLSRVLQVGVLRLLLSEVNASRRKNKWSLAPALLKEKLPASISTT